MQSPFLFSGHSLNQSTVPWLIAAPSSLARVIVPAKQRQRQREFVVEVLVEACCNDTVEAMGSLTLHMMIVKKPLQRCVQTVLRPRASGVVKRFDDFFVACLDSPNVLPQNCCRS